MSKHFEDARYYLGRAAEHAKAGMKEELETAEERVRELAGLEEEEVPEPSRIEKLQAELQELEERAEGEAKEAVTNARKRLQAYRGESDESGESEQTT